MKKNMLSHIGTKLHFTGKQQFSRKNKQQAHRRGTEYLYEKEPEGSKLQPLKENQVAVVQEYQHNDVDTIRRPSHGFWGRLPVVEFGAVARSKDIDQKGPHISNEYTGRCM